MADSTAREALELVRGLAAGSEAAGLGQGATSTPSSTADVLSGLLASPLFEGYGNATRRRLSNATADDDAALLDTVDSLAAAQLATLALDEEAVGTNSSLFKSSNRATSAAASVEAGSSAAFLPVGAELSLSEFGADPHESGAAASNVVRLSSSAVGVNATLSFAVDDAAARRLGDGNATVELACARSFVGNVSGICRGTGDVVAYACAGVAASVTVACPAPVVLCAAWDVGRAAWDGATCADVGVAGGVMTCACNVTAASLDFGAVDSYSLAEAYASEFLVGIRAGHGRDMPNFKGSDLGRFPLVSADFWTSDHLSERSRRLGAFARTRARGTLTLKRR
jgi:hypothetical protein